jgi:radical SAM protein with 4Fe4S-binding SPASM domain
MVKSDVLELLKGQQLRLPITLTIAITGACNLHCLHCWVEAGEVTSAEHVPRLILINLITEFKSLDGRAIRITGGEPLCHPDWLELMELSRTLGFSRVSLQTNGMLFTDDNVAALTKLDFDGLSLQISLDGATPASHDLVRGEGSYDEVHTGLSKLAAAGLSRRVTLFFTEMRHNLDELPALLEIADRFGIGAVVSGTLLSGGRAAAAISIAAPDADQYLRLLQRYDSDSRFRETYDRIGNSAALKWHSIDSARTECCTFVENPYITPDGRLYPCLMCHAEAFAVSGAFEKTLATALAEGALLWTELQQISRNRAGSISQCRECQGESACAGGCMGRALGACGDPMAADDRCEIRRLTYQHS